MIISFRDIVRRDISERYIIVKKKSRDF